MKNVPVVVWVSIRACAAQNRRRREEVFRAQKVKVVGRKSVETSWCSLRWFRCFFGSFGIDLVFSELGCFAAFSSKVAR